MTKSAVQTRETDGALVVEIEGTQYTREELEAFLQDGSSEIPMSVLLDALGVLLGAEAETLRKQEEQQAEIAKQTEYLDPLMEKVRPEIPRLTDLPEISVDLKSGTVTSQIKIALEDEWVEQAVANVGRNITLRFSEESDQYEIHEVSKKAKSGGGSGTRKTGEATLPSGEYTLNEGVQTDVGTFFVYATQTRSFIYFRDNGSVVRITGMDFLRNLSSVEPGKGHTRDEARPWGWPAKVIMGNSERVGDVPEEIIEKIDKA